MRWNIHCDTHTGAEVVNLLWHKIEEVLQCSLFPWCRAVILMQQINHLLQNLSCETKFNLRLKEEEETTQTWDEIVLKIKCFFFLCKSGFENNKQQCLTHWIFICLTVEIIRKGHSLLQGSILCGVGGVISLYHTHTSCVTGERRLN